MLVDDALLTREDDRWVAASDLAELPVPSTINALLAARLEGLPADERAILTTAAVEGAVFHRGAVARARLPRARPALEDGLLALVRRDLIRPEAADVRRRGGLPLPSRPDPRRRLSLAAEERARRPARALRRLARADGRGPAARVRGDRRLSPRAGLPVPRRARLARRARRLARRPGVRAARGGRAAGARPQRPARGDRPARAGVPAAPHRRSTADRAARRARRRADRKRPAGRGRARARRGGAAGCRRGRRARGGARARPAAVPPAPPRRGGRAGGGRAGGGPGDPGLRAPRGRPRSVPRTAARGVALL